MSSRLCARGVWRTCRALAPRARPTILPLARQAPPTAAAAAPRRAYTRDPSRNFPRDGDPDAPQSASHSAPPQRRRRGPEDDEEEAAALGADEDHDDYIPAEEDLDVDDTAGLDPTSEDGALDPSDEDVALGLSDDMLDALYGGGGGGSEQEEAEIPGGLSEEQQHTLFADGFIPAVGTGDTVDDALIAASQGQSPEDLLPPPPAGSVGGQDEAVAPRGYKWPLPELPLPPGSHLKYRYHPVLHQFTNLLMRDGRLSTAQTHMTHMLNFLRTSPPPIPSPKYPLLPNAPPPGHLPLNPVLYLTLAVDSVAPLVRIKRLKGLAGSGALLEIPVPIPVRTRRRTAFRWILDAVERRPSRGSGRKQLGGRLAEEIVAVVEGRSGVWDRREQVHRTAVGARANVFTPAYTMKKRR